jgi:hypothetical protein
MGEIGKDEGGRMNEGQKKQSWHEAEKGFPLLKQDDPRNHTK